MNPIKRLAVSVALILAAAISAAPSEARSPRFQHSSVVVPTVPTDGVLTPGAEGVTNVSWSATSTPAQQGNPADDGYADLPVASFVDPEFITFSAPAQIGVMAYHIPTAGDVSGGLSSNVQTVTVAIDGGTPVSTSAHTLNTRNNTVLYNFNLSSALADGLHEMRATVTPSTGLSLVLQGDHTLGGSLSRSLFFFTNFHGGFSGQTLYVSTTGTDNGGCGAVGSPCASLHQAKENIFTLQGSDVGGGTICPFPGTYPISIGSENFPRAAGSQALVIDGSCAPGATGATPASSNVILTSLTGGGLRVEKIKLANLKIDSTGVLSGGGVANGGTGSGASSAICWIDNVYFQGPGKFVTNAKPWVISDCTGGEYTTNSTEHNVHDGGPGALIANSTISHIGSDALSQNALAFNVTVDDAIYTTPTTVTSTSGSNILTGVTGGYADIVPGATILICGSNTSIAANGVDQIGNTITLVGTPNCNSTALFDPGTHPDMAQWVSSLPAASNVIFKNVVFSHFLGQGFFVQKDITGLVMDKVTWDNSYIASAFLLTNDGVGTTVTNWLSLDTSWLGNANTYNGTVTETKWIRSTCAAAPTGNTGNIKKVASPSC